MSYTPEIDLILLILRNYHKPNFKLEPSKIENIDWLKFYNIISRQKILLICYPIIAAYISQDYKGIYSVSYFKLKKRINDYSKTISDVKEVCSNYKIDFLIVKGLVLSVLLYDNIYLRESGDIDVLVVNQTDLSLLKKAMNDLGFLNSYKIENKILQVKEPSNDIRGVFHEFSFAKYNKQSYLWLEVKESTSAVIKPFISEFNKHTQYVDINGTKIKTHNLIYTFLHLCSNTYCNSERRLSLEHSMNIRDYFDVYSFILKYSDILEWKNIAELCNNFLMLHKMYYVLNKINIIFPNTISDETIQLFSLNRMTYDYSLTTDATVVAWKTPFIERLFMDDALRFKEYEFLYYKRLQSSLNIFSNDINHIYKYNQENSYMYNHMSCSIDSGISFDYVFTYDNKKDEFVICIRTDSKSIDNFNRMFIDFDFYFDPNKCGRFPRVIRTFIQDDGIYCSYGNRIVLLDEIQKQNDYYTLEIRIDSSYLFDVWKTDSVAYNIYVFKTVYSQGNPIIIGIKYGDQDDLEESPNLGLLSKKSIYTN